VTQTGLYVHWPYCAHVCPYCDFNVYRVRDHDFAPLLAAIAADLAAHAARLGRRQLASVFLGGGTPSLLGGAEIAGLLEAAAHHFDLPAECEVTLEANPEDAARFADFSAAGINRFSVGAQALDDAALKALGRWHDAAAAKRAVETAAATGRRVSLDLIYAREGQGVASWRDELGAALCLPVEHVSLYQLTAEPSTALQRRAARGQAHLPDVELAAQFYEETQAVCDAAGFPAYEISNHARTPDAQSRHNLLYWRGMDWIGIGPGAHGRLTQAGVRIATEAQRRPKDYIDAVRESGVGWVSEAILSREEIADEALLMGLRLAEGVDLAAIAALRGRAPQTPALRWLVEQGLARRVGSRVQLTAQGRLLADKIAAELSL
jgi:oxygen-independent coproporphyrinogen-3 oxidase